MRLLTIIYVVDQKISRDFYATTLGVEPYLDVPGMTEFDFAAGKLGIMPQAGIKRLLGDALPDPQKHKTVSHDVNCISQFRMLCHIICVHYKQVQKN
jgi:hypothetical protein